MLLNTRIMSAWQNWLIIPIMSGFFFMFMAIMADSKKVDE